MQNKSRPISLKERLSGFKPALLAAACVLFAGGSTSVAATTSSTSYLTLSGTGAASEARLTLTLPNNINLMAAATKDGAFTFRPIPYDFQKPLLLELRAPVMDANRKRLIGTNALVLTIKPRSYIRVQGTVTKAASVAVSVGGENSSASVSNNNGYFNSITQISAPMTAQNALVAASILNTDTLCCPRTVTPTLPLLITLKGTEAKAYTPPSPQIPLMMVRPVAPAPAKPPPSAAMVEPTPIEPQEAPITKKPPIQGPKPIFLSPINATPDDIIEHNSIEMTATFTSSERSFAAGGVATDNWVKGMKTVADIAMEALHFESVMIGGFIDAKTHLDSQLALQRLTAQAMKDYIPGEALCQFGTLSRSLAASEEHAQITQRAFSEVLGDRDTMRKQTVNAKDPSSGGTYRINFFQENYCHKTTENDAMRRFCSAAATPERFNHDVDYTRVFELPLTIGVNFAGTPTAPQKRINSEISALGSNLFSSEAFKGFTAEDFTKGSVTGDDVQNFRSVSAARSVARNSFTKMVGLKAMNKSNASQKYMLQVLKNLGLSEADSKRLIGENPSYFAQMEVMTKKIYQNPWFFAELYDKPTNVDRQRTAMLGISLQQQHDLLETLQRREMLLSTLLELRIRNAGSTDK